ncbi:MAG: ComF family protein [Nitrosomonas sp.]|nr:ComF family protein [Nitrosomonas sp.]MDP1950189.1 ComF family protein [Nitrosomonas sp.]
MSIYTLIFLDNKLNILQAFSWKNCLLCGTLSKTDLCSPCQNKLPQLPADHCPICLLPVATSLVCGACLGKPPAFTRTIAALHYTFPVDALIHSLKYQSNLAIAPILANLLIEKINTIEKPDFIIPMPLHPARLRERGFNQALEIGRYISKKNQIALLPNACMRIRNTPSQTGLPWKERQKNIRDAFSCKMDFSTKHVAILDDVMTTGATLNELAKVLLKSGATKVSGWVVARALPVWDKTTFNSRL